MEKQLTGDMVHVWQERFTSLVGCGVDLHMGGGVLAPVGKAAAFKKLVVMSYEQDNHWSR